MALGESGERDRRHSTELPGCYHLAHFLTGLAPITNQLARVVLLYLNRTQISSRASLWQPYFSLFGYSNSHSYGGEPQQVVTYVRALGKL